MLIIDNVCALDQSRTSFNFWDGHLESSGDTLTELGRKCRRHLAYESYWRQLSAANIFCFKKTSAKS